MPMSPQLRAMFSDEERQAASSLGTAPPDQLPDAITDLFRTLNDPLLSASDIAELLVQPKVPAVVKALRKLEETGVLESNDETQRPLDEAEVELFRLVDVPVERLKLTALEARLPEAESSVFQWTGDGRIIRSIARVSRLNAISGEGLQRKEIIKHVKRIGAGIENGAQVPNSLLLVLIEQSTTVEDLGQPDEDGPQSFIKIRPVSDFFTSTIPGAAVEHQYQQVRLVEIDIPYRRAAFDNEKPILLVDGQQRTAGLSLVSVDSVPFFEFPINAVIADEDHAKEVFSLANQTVKIAADFSRALVAAMGTTPPYLKSERVVAQVCHRLALDDKASPFKGLVKYPGTKGDKNQVIAYNTLFHVVTEFRDGGVLDEQGREDADTLTDVVTRAYSLVKATWPEAWGKRAGDSKLMHGAGLRAMGKLMAQELLRIDAEPDEKWAALKENLRLLKTRVVWTTEEAQDAPKTVQTFFDKFVKPRQNTSQDIAGLFQKVRDQLAAAVKEQSGA